MNDEITEKGKNFMCFDNNEIFLKKEQNQKFFII
jgi:hypothetical protein